MPNILIVDDSVLMRKLMQAHLGGMPNLTLCMASRADEALVQVQQGLFDLVVTDMQLDRNGGGADLVRAIRMIYRKDALPIVVMSTDGSSAEVMAALAGGANEFLSKPFSAPVLKQCITRLLNSTPPAAISPQRLLS